MRSYPRRGPLFGDCSHRAAAAAPGIVPPTCQRRMPRLVLPPRGGHRSWLILRRRVRASCTSRATPPTACASSTIATPCSCTSATKTEADGPSSRSIGPPPPLDRLPGAAPTRRCHRRLHTAVSQRLKLASPPADEARDRLGRVGPGKRRTLSHRLDDPAMMGMPRLHRNGPCERSKARTESSREGQAPEKRTARCLLENCPDDCLVSCRCRFR
jgi:hypothetical protein